MNYINKYQCFTYWRIISDSISDLILFGSYNDVIQYVKNKNIINPKIIPVDFKQISNKEKNELQIQSINISPMGNKNMTKLESILSHRASESSDLINESKKIIPIINLKSIKKSDSELNDNKLGIIDANSARKLMMDSCNKNFIQQINNHIRQRAIDGYTNFQIDLEELLNSKNHDMEIRNLNLSWNSSFNNRDYFERELNKITQYYKKLDFDLKMESNFLIISWF